MRCLHVSLMASVLLALTAQASEDRLPNIVILFCDDLGYGDFGCYGHPSIRTPNIDRMAREGMKFTNFYVAASLCTPSRAALLTGRLPIRSGMCSDKRGVLFPESAGGLPAEEITLAETLKPRGYATSCVGKWHLGHLPKYLPTQQGFDSYWGIPYSNDMNRRPGSGPKGREAVFNPKSEYWDVPILHNDKEVERPADQTTLTQRYTEQGIRFIQANQNKPFFLYLAYTMPHVPLFASKEFQGRSPRGIYGDVVEEIDASVGRILQTLRDAKLDSNTFVFLTSDNGPWLIYGDHAGSAGLLRDGKTSTWEGGMRVPGIAWWPGRIPAGITTQELACTMDLFTTATKLAGGTIPTDRVIDGVDLTPVLTGKGPSSRETMFYYSGTKLFAVRHKLWKAHFSTRTGLVREAAVDHDPPLLFHLGRDPGEKQNVAKDHPDVIAAIQRIAQAHRADLKPGKDQLAERLPPEKPTAP